MSTWRQVRIRDIAETFDGPHATPASTKTTTDGPVFLGISSLQNGRLDLSQSARMSEDDFRQWTRRVTPQPGDVVFSYETRLGQAALMPDGLRCSLGRRLALMRPNRSRVDPRFLLYAFLAPAFQEEIRSRTVHGSTVNRISLGDFPGFPLDVPDVAEQAGIAAMLGGIDDKVESDRRLATVALNLAESLYLDSCARASNLLKLGDAGKWLSGGTPSTSRGEYWGGELPWISSSTLKSVFVRDSDRRLTEQGAAVATHVVPPGAVLLVVRGMSLLSEFRVGVTQRPVAFGQDCKAILPSMPPTLLVTALRAAKSRILGLVDQAGHGTGRLSSDRLLNMRLPMPTESWVVDEIVTLYALAAHRSQESGRLARLRDALLPELMSGRIQVREAEEAVAGAV